MWINILDNVSFCLEILCLQKRLMIWCGQDIWHIALKITRWKKLICAINNSSTKQSNTGRYFNRWLFKRFLKLKLILIKKLFSSYSGILDSYYEYKPSPQTIMIHDLWMTLVFICLIRLKIINLDFLFHNKRARG